jgi:hypothetical protein
MDNMVNIIEEYRDQSLDAIQLVKIADEVINSVPLNEALSMIQNDTRNTNKLKTPDGEYLFIWEVFPTTSKENPRAYRSVVHVNDNLYNKTAQDALPYYETLRQNFRSVTNITDILDGIYNSIKGTPIIEPTKTHVYEYPWFDPKTSAPILKRSFSMLKEKDGRTFIIGSGFNVQQKKEEMDKIESQKKRLVLTLIVGYFISWFVLSWFVGFNRSPTLAIGVVISIVLYIQTSPVEGPKSEIDLYNSVRSTAIGIGAISLALALLLSNNHDKRLVRFIFIALFLISIVLIINVREVETERLVQFNTAIVGIIGLSISCIIGAIIIYLQTK